MDFRVDDRVMYANSDICRIEDIRDEKFSGEARLYYVMKPVFDPRSTLYCPVDAGEAKLRGLLSPEEVEGLFVSLEAESPMPWVENDQERKERFNTILRSGTPFEMLQLLVALYEKRASKLREGRKFYASDERVLKEAERVLHGEIACVLEMEVAEAAAYVQRRCGWPGEAD